MKVIELAHMLQGTVEGDVNTEIGGMNGIENAKEGDITFAMDEKKLILAEQTKASCILTSSRFRKSEKVTIRVKDPKLAFVTLYNTLNKKERREAYIDPRAVISKSASIGKGTWIGAHVSIEDGVRIGDHTVIEHSVVIKKNTRIGADCHLYPNITIYDNAIIGNRVILHAGVVVGSDGFGYIRNKDTIVKFPQLGNVILEDDIEIGANSCVDRGALGSTRIGRGTKIDNLCQVAHNVVIGKNCLIAGQTGIGGSAIIGENATFAGQVGVADNIKVGRNITVGGQSGVLGTPKEGVTLWGYPARDVAFAKKQLAVISWLTKNFYLLQKQIKRKK